MQGQEEKKEEWVGKRWMRRRKKEGKRRSKNKIINMEERKLSKENVKKVRFFYLERKVKFELF